MVKNGPLAAVHPRRPGEGMAPAQWARWLDHLSEAAGTQMPRTSDAASAVAQAWRAAREGHRGLLFAAARSQYAPR